jgi:hypothetical protein
LPKDLRDFGVIGSLRDKEISAVIPLIPEMAEIVFLDLLGFPGDTGFAAGFRFEFDCLSEADRWD